MLIRLSHVEKTIGSNFERSRTLTDRFRVKAESVLETRGKTGAAQATAVFQEEGQQAILDTELLLGLAAADLQVENARLCVAMEHNQGDVQRRLEGITKKIEDYKRVLSDLTSVKAIAEHANACAQEMGWFQRNVFARGVAKEAKTAAAADIQDVCVPAIDRGNGVSPSFVFWRDDSGKTQVRMLPCEDQAIEGP